MNARFPCDETGKEKSSSLPQGNHCGQETGMRNLRPARKEIQFFFEEHGDKLTAGELLQGH